MTQSRGVIVSQRKYALGILQDTNLANCRPIDSPMDSTLMLMRNHYEIFSNLERYRMLVEKLIYITMIRADLSYPLWVMSQFMHNPHITLITRILWFTFSYMHKGSHDRDCCMRTRQCYQILAMAMLWRKPVIVSQPAATIRYWRSKFSVVVLWLLSVRWWKKQAGDRRRQLIPSIYQLTTNS